MERVLASTSLYFILSKDACFSFFFCVFYHQNVDFCFSCFFKKNWFSSRAYFSLVVGFVPDIDWERTSLLYYDNEISLHLPLIFLLLQRLFSYSACLFLFSRFLVSRTIMIFKKKKLFWVCVFPDLITTIRPNK